jgi:hypothetical protein
VYNDKRREFEADEDAHGRAYMLKETLTVCSSKCTVMFKKDHISKSQTCHRKT